MKNKTARISSILVLFILAIFVFSSTFGLAWLTADWGKAFLKLKTDNDDFSCTVEMWMNEDGDNWETVSLTDEDVSTDVYGRVTPSVGVFGDSTVSPDSGKEELSLYFGRIQSLVDSSETPPVYLKCSIEVKAHQQSKITLNYSLPADYVSVYQTDEEGVGTAYEIIEEVPYGGTATPGFSVQDTTQFPFLSMSFYKFDSDGDYSISQEDGKGVLPSDIDDIFEGETPGSTEYSDSTNTFTFSNETDEDETYYFYIHFALDLEPIRDLLERTNVKNTMPSVFFFSVDFSFDVEETTIPND